MEETDFLRKELHALKEKVTELTDELAEWKDFAENAAMPLHWVNGSGIVVWVNQTELDLLGYKRLEFVNQHISKFHADADVIENILKRLINKETLIDYPARLMCKNGDIKHVLINSNVYWRNDQFVHTRCFSRDVTAFKLAQDEKDKLIKTLQARIDQLENGQKSLRTQRS